MFTIPWAFLALLSLPVLASLYWLRNAYRRVPVSSLMLWLEQMESRASGLRVKKLQTPLLFFLELAALALMALAATGPRLETLRGEGPLVIVLDDSYSMLAGDEEAPRRLAQQALEAELSLDASQDVRFVLAGSYPQALGEAVSSQAEMRDLLTGWRCRDPVSKLAQALAFAGELAGAKSRVLVLSDHAAPKELLSDRVRWWSFGRPRDNVAIVQGHRSSQDDRDRLSLEVANLSSEDHTARLVLNRATLLTSAPTGKVNTVHEEILPLKAGESRRLLLQLKGEVGALSARIDSDALDIDNQAWFLPDAAEPIRVQVNIENEPLRNLVEKALKATGKTIAAADRTHLLITNAAEMPTADAGTWVVQLLQEKEAESFVGPFILDRGHPLTQGLDLAGVAWGGGKSRELSGMPIVLAGNVPLVTDAESARGQHRLQVRLRPDLSTLPESPAWPVLVWNLVNWRAAEMPGSTRANVRLGEAVTLRVAPDVDSVRFLSGGRSGQLPVFERKVMLTPVDVGQGFFDAKGYHHFTVSALNRDESDLQTCETGRWGEWSEEPSSASARYNLAWILLLGVLAVLSVHLYLAGRGG